MPLIISAPASGPGPLQILVKSAKVTVVMLPTSSTLIERLDRLERE